MRKKLCLTTVAAAVLLLAGCGVHLVYHARSGNIPFGSTIGVLVDMPYGQSSNNDVASFMSAALMRRGYHVKSINPPDLIPKSVLECISTSNHGGEENRKYAFVDAIIRMLEKNGGKLKGDKAMWEKLLQMNEIKEASLRFSDLNELIDEFVKRWDTEFILFVVPAMDMGGVLNPYQYMVKAIRLKDRETIFVYYMHTDEIGFADNIPQPIGIPINDQTEKLGEFSVIKFCEHIAEQLSENKGSEK